MVSAQGLRANAGLTGRESNAATSCTATRDTKDSRQADQRPGIASSWVPSTRWLLRLVGRTGAKTVRAVGAARTT